MKSAFRNKLEKVYCDKILYLKMNE